MQAQGEVRQSVSIVESLRSLIRGAYAYVCSEIKPGDRFDEARVKFLTGGDHINAAACVDPFSFEPTHKLWLLGNTRPENPVVRFPRQ